MGETTPDAVDVREAARADTVPPPPTLAVALLVPMPGEEEGVEKTVKVGVYVEKGALAEGEGVSVPPPPPMLLLEEGEGLREVEGKEELLTLPPPTGVPEKFVERVAREDALKYEELVSDTLGEAEPPPIEGDPEEDGDVLLLAERLGDKEVDGEALPLAERVGDKEDDTDVLLLRERLGDREVDTDALPLRERLGDLEEEGEVFALGEPLKGPDAVRELDDEREEEGEDVLEILCFPDLVMLRLDEKEDPPVLL